MLKKVLITLCFLLCLGNDKEDRMRYQFASERENDAEETVGSLSGMYAIRVDGQYYTTVISPKGDEVSAEEMSQCEYIGVIEEYIQASDSLEDMQMNFMALPCEVYRKSEYELIAKWPEAEKDSEFYNDEWSGKTYRFSRNVLPEVQPVGNSKDWGSALPQEYQDSAFRGSLFRLLLDLILSVR